MIQQDRSQETSQCAQLICDNLPEKRVRLMDVACERGALSWLSALPYTVMHLIYTRGCFKMPCVSAMAGDPLITLELVFVGTLSLLLIL